MAFDHTRELGGDNGILGIQAVITSAAQIQYVSPSWKSG